MTQKKQAFHELKKQSSRTRNYVSILYPESCAEDWKDFLSSSGIPCVISPLHDKDLDLEVSPCDEWEFITKKAHYHIMVCFDGPKSIDQAQAIFDRIGAIKCFPVDSIRGMARYFCHLDNPEKHQYSPSEVTCIGGLDYDAIISLPSDDIQIVIDMCQFIVKNQVFSFRLFADICASDFPDWFTVLFRRTSYYIKEYIKSYFWDFQHPQYLEMCLYKKEKNPEKS